MGWEVPGQRGPTWKNLLVSLSRELCGDGVTAGHASAPSEGFGSRGCRYSALQDQSRSAAPGRANVLPFAVLFHPRGGRPSSHPPLCLQDPLRPNYLCFVEGGKGEGTTHKIAANAEL